jgi:hypothetical protein
VVDKAAPAATVGAVDHDGVACLRAKHAIEYIRYYHCMYSKNTSMMREVLSAINGAAGQRHRRSNDAS